MAFTFGEKFLRPGWVEEENNTCDRNGLAYPPPSCARIYAADW
jgi:hypothetical protein